MNTILLYSPEISPRLQYICHWIFQEIGGLRVTITPSRSTFENTDGTLRINYSHEKLRADVHWIPHGFLFENTIKNLSPTVFHLQNTPNLFPVQGGDLPYDILSAAFYCISRFEEYTTTKRDAFDRFPHTESWAYQQQVLNRPIVDEWIQTLFAMWKQQFPALNLKQNIFQFIPTYDIDIAYSYYGKPFYKQIASWLRGEFGMWFKWKFKHEKDPYDAYDQLDAWHQQYQLSPIYFILLSEGGTFNKNLNPQGKAMQDLLLRLKQQYIVGLHPSYVLQHNAEQFWRNEKQIIGETLHTRQHYIRFELPTTYRQLETLGFTQDYSMGYGSINGFRASTSRSFLWYDLAQERISNLRIHPFCFMECNSRFEQGYSPEQAAEELKHYEQIVRQVNGTLISIWHNFSLGNDKAWQGWKRVYIEFFAHLHR